MTPAARRFVSARVGEDITSWEGATWALLESLA